MKKRLVFLCCALGLLLATGCSPMPAAPEDLLDAPKLSEKQYEVDRALREQVGQDIKLKYPSSCTPARGAATPKSPSWTPGRGTGGWNAPIRALAPILILSALSS